MITIHSGLTNLDTVKAELVQYHDSGKYNQQIIDVNTAAKNYLIQRIDENKYLRQPKKLAIVFDIDETSLSNYPDLLQRDFSRAPQQFINGQMKAHDPAIGPTLALFQLAEKDHVAVFFITGRTESLRSPTVKNLDSAGYYAYNGLFLKPDNYKNASVVPFKSETRKAIEAKGYDIVLSVGDQESDISGGFEDRGFKLPNPYYYIA
jgi:predicted secreted acid phosphatase